jgi:hypothetical protein
VALPTQAQFQHLATDNTGSRVWFSSRLRQGSTNQHDRDKVFVADNQGSIDLVAQRPLDDFYPLLSHPQVSADGRTLAYSTTPDCLEPCPELFPYRSIVSVAGQPDREFLGYVEMSRNGRYLLRHSYGYFGPSEQVELIDLETNAGVAWAVSDFEVMTGATQVTSDGAAIIYARGLWVIRRDGTFDRVPANFGPAPDTESGFGGLQATVNNAGTRVVYQATFGTPYLDLTSPGLETTVRTLVSAEDGVTNPVFSADGSRVLFLSAADFSGGNPARLQQAWIVEVDTGKITQVTADAAGIAEATLSGDGGAQFFTGRTYLQHPNRRLLFA